jgi:double-strand break repair protein MRE11
MFSVMQPGSSIATSLVAGEAVPKHVAIVSVSGKEFTTENIRLKSVRPFITKDLALGSDDRFKKLAKKNNNRAQITTELEKVVRSLIQQAKEEWLEVQEEEVPEEEIPLPLVRLRVDTTVYDGGKFEIENPQRFSNRFIGDVANVTDVVQFHSKKGKSSMLSNSISYVNLTISSRNERTRSRPAT